MKYIPCLEFCLYLVERSCKLTNDVKQRKPRQKVENNGVQRKTKAHKTKKTWSGPYT